MPLEIEQDAFGKGFQVIYRETFWNLRGVVVAWSFGAPEGQLPSP